LLKILTEALKQMFEQQQREEEDKRHASPTP
jgi:hypothetical protein